VSGESYVATYVDQTPIPCLRPGELGVACLRLRNVGTATWRKDGPNPVLLATDRPRDRPSPFHVDGAWPRPNRLAFLREPVVAPGEVGSFEVLLRAPAAPGRYVEHVCPIAEHLTWFQNLEFHFVVDVAVPVAGEPPDLAYAVVDPIPPLLLAPGDRATLHVAVRNTGRVRWTDRGGDYGPLVQVGTVEPFDHHSPFHDPERWLAPYRPSRAPGFVLPGQTASFVVPIKAPAAQGVHEDRFGLVAELRGWLGGPPLVVRVLVP